jgi:Secretion system C-terminal sorting domain
MKKVIFFSLLVFFGLQNCFSQDIKQNVIASAGGIAQTDKISFEWTLGEFAVETITTEKNLYTQGFHQPVLMVKSFHSPPKPELTSDLLDNYKIVLAPNPAKSFVNVHLSAKKSEKFFLSLYDMNGKEIQSRQVSGTILSVRIEMGSLPSGIYLVNVRNDSGTMRRAFKVVKGE